MCVQMVATAAFALAMATAMLTRGLPPVAYTIPDRLAVLDAAAFGGHPGRSEVDGMAGLRPR